MTCLDTSIICGSVVLQLARPIEVFSIIVAPKRWNFINPFKGGAPHWVGAVQWGDSITFTAIAPENSHGNCGKNQANAPGNRPSQKEMSIPTIHFQVRTVSFREGNF